MLLIWALLLARPTETRADVAQPTAAIVREMLANGRYLNAEPRAREALVQAEAEHGPHAIEIARALDLLLETLALSRAGDAALAKTLADRAIAIKEQLLGAKHPAIADTLDLEAWALREVSWVRAHELLEKSVDLRVAAFGPEHVETARSDYLMGRLLLEARLFGAAKPYVESAWRIRREKLGPDHPETLRALGARGRLAADEHDVPACEELLGQVLAARERDLGADHPEVAESLRDVAACRDAAHDKAGQLRALEGALAIDQKTFGLNHPATAMALAEIASYRTDRLELDEANAAYERALGILTRAEEATGDSRIVSVRIQYADYLFAAGELDEACETAAAGVERALEIYGPSPRVAFALRTLGRIQRERGEYALAKVAMERAVSTQAASSGENTVDYAAALHDLATIHVRMWDDAAARPLFERAISIYRQASGEDDAGEWPYDYFYAALLSRVGERKTALSYSARAIHGIEQIYGPDYGGLTSLLGSRVKILGLDGQFDAALPLAERAIAIAEKSSGPESGGMAYVLNSVCVLHQARGDPATARGFCERAVAIAQKVFGEHHPRLTSYIIELENVLIALHDTSEALRLSLRVEREARNHFLRTERLLSEREALRFGDIRASGRDLAMSALAEMGAPGAPSVRSTWDEIIRSRTLVFDEMATRQRSMLSDDDPEARAAGERVDRARAELSRALTRAATRPSDETRAAVGLASREVGEAERELAAQSADFRRVQERERVGLEQVQQSLPADAALVAYVRFRKGWDEASRDLIAAFVLPGAGQDPQIVFLGPTAAIDERVAAWRNEVANRPPAGNAAKAALSRYERAATVLRQAVWDPVRSHLGNPRIIFIVPDGSLNLVNFATLPTDGGRYIVEDTSALHVIAAEHELVDVGQAVSSGHGVLVLGGPDFDRAATTTVVTSVRPQTELVALRGAAMECQNRGGFGAFGPLPRARVEIDEIAAICKRRLPDGSDVVRLTGADATEAAFKRIAPGRRIVHLATHGFVLDESCLAPSASRAATPDELLQLSGLAFAGANRYAKAEHDEDDGILTAEEVVSMDLTGVDWVVLSACETGLGKVHTGEGVLGLRRAFSIAGARTLIASLWRIRDDDARQWMRRLYEARGAGQDTADAVRTASRGLLAARRSAGASSHPFYWGAFVAAGGWH